MALTPDLKLVQCVEWTTEKLYGIRPWISPTFSFQGKPCYLMLYVSGRGEPEVFCFFMYICGIQRFSLPFKVRVLVDNAQFPSAIHTPVKTINDQSDYIWKYSIPEFCELCKMEYQKIEYLSFSIMFYDDYYRRNKGEKCVQTSSYLNADTSMEGLSKDFSELLDSGENHDTEILCGQYSVKVHKIVLCARSDVFKAMLQSDMLEGRTGVVEIQDIDDSFFQDFIKYLYTDVLPEMTFEKAVALYEAGDKYDVRSLVLRCSEYLQDDLSLLSACQCLALADVHSDQKLKESALAYILCEKIYLQEEHWLPFCESYPKIANEVYRLSHKNITESKDQ